MEKQIKLPKPNSNRFKHFVIFTCDRCDTKFIEDVALLLSQEDIIELQIAIVSREYVPMFGIANECMECV